MTSSKTMSTRIGRRAMLRGACGVAVGLPLLHAMMDDNGLAFAGGLPFPLRFLIAFGGFSLGQDDDPQMVDYGPSGVGGSPYPNTTCLSPLFAHGVEGDVSVVTDLTIPSQQAKLTSEPIPPMGRTVGFHFHTNPLISGNRSLTNGFFDSTVTGPSADQVMAQAIGGDTTFPYLSYRAQALFYWSNPGGVDIPNNRDTLSFDQSGTPIPPTVSPRLAYDTLFTGFVPDDPVAAAAAALALDKRKSVLDLVDRRMGGLLDKLGAADKHRIEEHFTQIRALEDRLAKAPPPMVGACELLPDPGQDPPLGGEPTGATDYDINKGYSGEEQRIRTLLDLIHMAFVCDQTRVAALMMSFWQSFMNIHPLTGWASNMHITNHGQNPSAPRSELESVVSWHVDQFGYLVDKLKATPEGAGNVLDNCALVFLNEGGHGYGYEAGKMFGSHSTDNMVALIAGRAGGLAPGQHVVAQNGNNHPVNVTISAMKAAGYTGNNLGEVNDPIDALFMQG